MSLYSIKDTTLTAIGDAIREKNGSVDKYTSEQMATAILAINTEGGGGITPEGELDIVQNGDYDVTTYASAHVAVPVGIFPVGTLDITQNGNYDCADYESVYVDVPSSGGGVEPEPIVLTGDQGSAFASPIAAAYLEMFPESISTRDLKNAPSMFENFAGTEIPFALNWINYGYAYNYSNANYLFRYSGIHYPPAMNYFSPNGIPGMFQGCSNLVEVPEGWSSTWYWDYTHNENRNVMSNYVFYGCYSLKKIDSNLLKNLWNNNNQTYGSCYAYLFQDCYNLSEVVGLGVSPYAKLTGSNVFYYTWKNNYCMRRFTFDTNNGVPITAQWNGMTIDLCQNFGFYYGGTMSGYFYNSGRTLDDRIYDAESYARNKNNPNAYVACTNYDDAARWSLYNKAAAEETIRSLPDCSSYGYTNTLKLNSAQGEYTDEGAIGSISQEVIDLAAAKGWTIQLV